jgi:predicted transposase YbfD/YdcC
LSFKKSETTFGSNGVHIERSVRPRLSTGGKKRSGKGRKIKPAKPFPQYSFDGKARKGCRSAETGREEIDVTMYCPETKQVLDKRTLDDKEGERSAVIEMLSRKGRKILPGIVSGDAGIVSPEVTAAIIRAGHGYVLQIKGNSGFAFNEAQGLPWSGTTVDVDLSYGHGREELRRTRAVDTNAAQFKELKKYVNVGVVLCVDRDTRKTSTGQKTHETSYYIGDETFATVELATQARYVRDHWGQESFHWIKDAVLKEDASMQRAPNGSRAMATIRSLVAKVGQAVCGSAKGFIDDFVADPKGMVLNI